MTATVKALVITADGMVEARVIVPDLDTLQAIVGGLIECVSLASDCHLYCSEEGKLDGLPVNAAATMLVEHCRPGFMSRDVIVGDVVVLGSSPDGEEADVPPRMVFLVGHP